MNTFDEVLKKHFGEWERGRYFIYDNAITYQNFVSNNTEFVELFYCKNTLQTFTSPEKLDQFLTLLFE